MECGYGVTSFCPQEADRIKAMPIFNEEEEDKLVWWRSRSGSYMVKLAYFTVMEELVDSDHLRLQGSWLSIWKLKVPQKIKLLLWRAARGCLPTRCNLQRKHVPCEGHCPMCEGNPENEWHIFFDCEQAVAIWNSCGLAQQIREAMEQSESFRECLFKLLQVLAETSRNIVAMMCWSIWKRRNDKVWEGSIQPVASCVSKALDYLHDWNAAKIRRGVIEQHANNPTIAAASWQKPPFGELKCNVDAAIFSSENKYVLVWLFGLIQVPFTGGRLCGLTASRHHKKQRLWDYGRVYSG